MELVNCIVFERDWASLDFECLVCGKTCSSIGALNQHEHTKVHRQCVDGEWHCAICWYRAVRKYDLMHHVQLRHGCRECDLYHNFGECLVEDPPSTLTPSAEKRNKRKLRRAKLTKSRAKKKREWRYERRWIYRIRL